MSTTTSQIQGIATHVLEHLLQRIEETSALDEPFSHIYLEEVFPADIYEQMLILLPDTSLYGTTAERHHGRGEAGGYTRSMFALTSKKIAGLSAAEQDLWRGVSAALTAPALKRAMFTKLSRDLVYRYAVPESRAAEIQGYSRPTLYRETEGFEIPPHPDTRKKIVTMHLYLPADRSQLDLGTAFYRHKPLALPFGNWRRRFTKVKQFAFQPNSGYAFVVNNSLTKKSWHGREVVSPGAGVRNTLLNTYFQAPREEFAGYLD